MDVKTVLDAVTFRDEKMAKVNLFDTERCFCDLYCLKPGQAQAVHEHADLDKVYWVLQGSAIVTVGEEQQELSAGESVLAPSGAAHGIANQSDREVVCFVVGAGQH